MSHERLLYFKEQCIFKTHFSCFKANKLIFFVLYFAFIMFLSRLIEIYYYYIILSCILRRFFFFFLLHRLHPTLNSSKDICTALYHFQSISQHFNKNNVVI